MQLKPLPGELPPDLCRTDHARPVVVCCAKKDCCKKYKKGKPCKKCPKKKFKEG